MMSDGDIRPTGITLDREQHELRVDWVDGHQSVFPLNELREACPCAECRGGHAFMGPAHDPNLLSLTPVRSYKVENINQVGNYALQLWWDDGHNSGIYTWNYLRRIDPYAPKPEEEA